MRVLMLGWEFPPAVSGGLGTACLGLTRALSRAGADITFILPRCDHADAWSKVEVVGLHPPGTDPIRDGHPGPSSPVGIVASTAAAAQPHTETGPSNTPESLSPPDPAPVDRPAMVPALAGVEFVHVEASLWPYRRPDDDGGPAYGDGDPARRAAEWTDFSARHDQTDRVEPPLPPGAVLQWPEAAAFAPAVPPRRAVRMPGINPVDDDVFQEVQRYARKAAHAAAERTFDLVHAHDWMTYPAAEVIADISGVPFVAHVHSTEFDRSGAHIDQRIYDIERAGLDRADLVIAVSHLTRGILISRYNVPADKIVVIYNAIGSNGAEGARRKPRAIKGDEKIVLFMGRITMQKGPEYFLAAARKVLQVYDNVRFVMAGSGDAIQETMDLAEDMGLGEKVVFTGFLEGGDVERVFRSADLYVMPSVSDPFGIASLEAISFDVPVLISRQSGAAEVLRHVLKVDFWDIEEMANKIVAVLRHPPLHATLKKQASFELRRLTWSDAASRCAEAYAAVLGRRGLASGAAAPRPI